MTDQEHNDNSTKEYSAKAYFDMLKSSIRQMDDTSLTRFAITAETMAKQAYALNQEKMLKKLLFMIQCIEKEKKLLEFGLNNYILRDDIERFISGVKGRVVKIIELKNYPRQIPPEIAECVIKLNEAKTFDNYFVIFTDYTDTPKVQQEYKKERDPILFGVFESVVKKEYGDGTIRDIVNDRFYVIGDWEDEYCDLTLTKMIDTLSSLGVENSLKETLSSRVSSSDITVDEIFRIVESQNTVPPDKVKEPFFKGVKKWFTER
jgi:hypothetical protein